MIAVAPACPAVATPDRQGFAWACALIVACAAADAVAAAVLLLDTSLPSSLLGPTAVAGHATAVLLTLGLARARPSRRWLFVAPVLAIPLVGVAVAAASCFTRGRGTIEMRRRQKARRSTTPTVAAIQRLVDALSPSDALDCGDEEHRRAALSALARRQDPDAIATLRRATAGGDPEVALSAALILDEVGKRTERRMDRQMSGGQP